MAIAWKMPRAGSPLCPSTPRRTVSVRVERRPRSGRSRNAPELHGLRRRRHVGALGGVRGGGLASRRCLEVRPARPPRRSSARDVEGSVEAVDLGLVVAVHEERSNRARPTAPPPFVRPQQVLGDLFRPAVKCSLLAPSPPAD